MSNESRDHETRISRIEGILESLATKEDLAKLETRLNSKIDDKINEQTKLFSGQMRGVHEAINKLNEKQHRLTGAAELIRFVIPVAVSVIALLIAIIRPF